MKLVFSKAIKFEQLKRTGWAYVEEGGLFRISFSGNTDRETTSTSPEKGAAVHMNPKI